jgi:D,D-heptose 1,7-bisphosphate phosphatase
MMQTVILAGGKGTRIRLVAGNRPKSLVPVAGKAFIEHQFDLLRESGVRDVLICAGFGAEELAAHVGDGSRFGLSVRLRAEDPDRLLGTGGALVAALPDLASEFMVLYGDSYLPVRYDRIAATFRRSGCPALMTVYPNQGRWDRSNTRARDGRVVFYSKTAGPGEADAIDYGLTFYRREVIDRYRAVPPPLDLQSILQDLIASGGLAAGPVEERFYEIGKPEGWLELDDLLTLKQEHRKRAGRAVFLDRDGTLNAMCYDEDHGIMDSPRRPEQLRPVRGAGAFIARMKQAGFKVLVVTNQPGLAKGTLTEAAHEAVTRRLAEALAAEGASWDGLYVCPHHPAPGEGGNPLYAGDCLCRKPLPGLLYRAAREHDIDLASSWMIGDGLNDMQAGRAAGCRTILLTRIKMEQIEKFLSLENAEPDLIAPDFTAAAEAIEKRTTPS